MIDNWTYITPELFLSLSAMFILMVGVFSKGKDITSILFVSMAAIFAVTIYILYHTAMNAASNDFMALSKNADKGYEVLAFNRGFIFDSFSYFMKMLICIVCIGVSIICLNTKFYSGTNRNCFEFPVLVILSVVGAFILASANDLMALYIGLELMSLALYVLVSINRDSEQSTESGVKYFVLGALASGILLFGVSLVYGFSGTTNLGDLSALIKMNHTLDSVSPGIVFGMVLILAGLFFKLSAVPMHMWAPDVYEGSTKAVVSFISTAPKIASLAFLTRLLTSIDPDVFTSFSKIIILVSAASMILGSFAALRQNNIKRLLAYSSIGNMGYILIALAIGTQAAIESGIIYIFAYMISSIGVFAIVSILQKNNDETDKISEFAGLAKTNPLLAISLAIFMFSVAGIPPMAGFLGKFFVFKQAVVSGHYILAVIGVVTSVVACYYYLRIIKVMYFDVPQLNAAGKPVALVGDYNFTLKFLIGFSVAIILTMFLFAGDMVSMAQIAASSLF